MALVRRAIVRGEREVRQLAKLRDPRCHKSEEEIAEQLTGPWREDHLFSLGQALKMYEAIQERIQDYERAILEKLKAMEREECSATRTAGVEEQEESPNHPPPRTRAAAPSPVSRQRSGSDGD